MTEARSHGCRRAAAIGCAGAALLFVIAAAVVGLNLDRIRDSEPGQTVARTWREGRAGFEELTALQSEILGAFRMESCEINLKWRVYGEPGKTLELILLNPDLGGEEDAEVWAREVALLAVERYDAIDSIHSLEIEIRREAGLGVLSHRTSYSFPVAELRSSLLPGERDDAFAGDELLLPKR